jgi:hypothetical protein
MDRKSWIIVTLCVILMGVNWHYMQENQKLAQAEEARAQAEKAKDAPSCRCHHHTAQLLGRLQVPRQRRLLWSRR